MGTQLIFLMHAEDVPTSESFVVEIGYLVQKLLLEDKVIELTPSIHCLGSSVPL